MRNEPNLFVACFESPVTHIFDSAVVKEAAREFALEQYHFSGACHVHKRVIFRIHLLFHSSNDTSKQ
jgi:hypothetical protein